MTWLFQTTDAEAVLNRKLAQEGGASVLFGRDTRESNKLHKSWRRSKFCKDVDKLLSGEQLGTGDDPSSRSDDEDSELESEQHGLHDQLSAIPQEDDISPGAGLTSPRTAPFAQQTPSFTQHGAFEVPLSLPRQPAVATTLPSSTWRLLEVYFSYTQPWLPICEKHDMLRLSYSYPEAGLMLSTDSLPNHADHAELWSVLAVAAVQENMANPDVRRETSGELSRLYDIARTLIPTECGNFAVGHVRALLNLAVVNLSSLKTEVAWLLVGSASRILLMMENSSQPMPTRWKHLLSSCFMLDSLLSLQLHRRPYILGSDILRIGRIEEDGLEEWQPWSGPLHTSANAFARTPALSISSFNKLIELVEIFNMCNSVGIIDNQLTPQQVLHRLESWTTSLPPKFNYISDDQKATPHNPPAILLQLAYLSYSSLLIASSLYVQRILDTLEQYLNQVGVVAVPPIVLCLLAHVQANGTFTSLDMRLQERIRKFEADLVHAWSGSPPQRQTSVLVPTHSRRPGSIYQVQTPESIQVPPNPSFTPGARSIRERAGTSLLDDLLPDMNSAISMNQRPPVNNDFRAPPLENEFRRPSLRHRNSAASRDVETFFDELASLDGAEMVDNQPQFMQNLGFAPDANMADFLALELGQYIPANSSTLLPPSNDPTHLDPAFFDGS